MRRKAREFVGVLALSAMCGWDAGPWFEASAHPAATQATKNISAKIQRAPDDALLYVERARQWRLQHEDDHARRDLRRALRRHPHLAAAHHEWGLLELARGHESPALRQFTAAIEASPTWWRPRHQRGQLLLRRGQRAKAVEDLRVALTHRGSPDDFDAVAHALRQLERDEEAAALLLEGAATTGAVVLATKAIEAYRALGRLEEAMRGLDVAQRLGADPFSMALTAVGLGIQMGAWEWALHEASLREVGLRRSFARRATPHRQAQLDSLEALREEARQLGALAPQDRDALACLPSSFIEHSLPRIGRITP